MSRLREITERDRAGELSAALEAGEEVDYDRLRQLQKLDLARAGRAALLDALDLQDQANGDLDRILGE